MNTGVNIRQARIKAGHPERVEWGMGLGGRIELNWEVWGEIRPLRAMWTVTLEIGEMHRSKAAFDDFEEAVAAMETIKRQYAVDIARLALRIRKR